MTFVPLTYAGAQANTIAVRPAAKHGTPTQVEAESVFDALSFDPDRTGDFEEAMREFGASLGSNSRNDPSGNFPLAMTTSGQSRPEVSG